jgi:hypothetical protein
LARTSDKANSQEKARQEKSGQEENREKESGQEAVALVAGVPANKNPAIRGRGEVGRVGRYEAP